MLKKILIVGFVFLVIIGIIRSCVSGDDESDITTTTVVTTTETPSEKTTKDTVDNITKIEFSNSVTYKLKVGDYEYSSLRVLFDDKFSEDDIVFISSDENIVTVEAERKSHSLLYFEINAIGTGTATIHAETANGLVKSEDITVIVSALDESNDEKDLFLTEYVLNTDSMKIHKITCSSLDGTDAANFNKTSDYDGAISDGYVPCKICNP